MTLVAPSALLPPPTPARLYTYDELQAELPESNALCELWDGVPIMSPSPSFLHQEIAFRMQRALQDWVKPRGLGRVAGAPLDMILSPHLVMQPDVVYVAQERQHLIRQAIQGPADLVVEIISPGGRNRDRIEKRDLYEQHGIREYWIIDPESGSVDVLALANARYDLVGRYGAGARATSRLLPGFEVAVDDLMGSGCGEV